MRHPPVITWLDRLGRSLLHLVTLGGELCAEGIGLRVVEQGIDIDTVEGRARFGRLLVLAAEFQRELIVASTGDGLATPAAAGGAPNSRPPRSAKRNGSTTKAATPSNRSSVSSASNAPLSVQTLS